MMKQRICNTQTIRYGSYSYAYSALTGGTSRGPIRTLMKNLYLLSTAAAEYFS